MHMNVIQRSKSQMQDNKLKNTTAAQVITTMAIRPLDDYSYCARSAFTYLRIWQKLYDCS